jgi:hypothetical protein
MPTSRDGTLSRGMGRYGPRRRRREARPRRCEAGYAARRSSLRVTAVNVHACLVLLTEGPIVLER